MGSSIADAAFFTGLWLLALYGFYTLMTNKEVYGHGELVLMAVAYPSVFGSFFIPVFIGGVLGGPFVWVGFAFLVLFIVLVANVS